MRIVARHSLKQAPTQEDLLKYHKSNGCDNYKLIVYSNKTRSKRKQYTFYLADVDKKWRKGSLDTREWTTYFHAYPNNIEGVTVQYWRFYAYNDAANNHGGDWECIFVVLDSQEKPKKIGFMGHTSIDYKKAAEIEWENGHPVIYSEGGGHASHSSGFLIAAKNRKMVNKNDPATNIRHETWTGGKVRWFDGKVTSSGKLINVGEKTRPMNKQVFIQYSGLWGSPGATFISSGYWGPAYNETGMSKDATGFVNVPVFSTEHIYVPAWCSTRKDGYKNHKECWIDLCR